MRGILRQSYCRMFSPETRYWLYKIRHLGEFRELVTQCNSSGKGDFSLRGFAEREAIFVHVTKSAGTSVATSLFGYLPSHYSAWQYRVIFGKRDFTRYFKFSFVRNPWDRLYSAFSYLKGGGWDWRDERWFDENLSGVDDFNQFVMEWLTPERLHSHVHFWPQSHFIFDKRGNLLIDYLGYFETLGQDFFHIASRINPEAKLTRTNSSQRGSYLDVYTPEAIAKVEKLYAEDISNFGYSFRGLARKRVVNGVLVDGDCFGNVPDRVGPISVARATVDTLVDIAVARKRARRR